MVNPIILAISILILICSVINIYTYYIDVKETQQLNKEKLRLEIELLKLKTLKEADLVTKTNVRTWM